MPVLTRAQLETAASLLPPGLLHLAEADLSHANIRAAIERTLSEDSDAGEYYWIADIFGDEASGYVVCGHGGRYYKRLYEIAENSTATLGEEETEVMVRTEYEEIGESASLTAADGDGGLQEREIPQSTRAKMSGADFAGKGKSFPIQKPSDVLAAVRSIGRAGAANYSADKIKANIIRIAKRKGKAFLAALPKAWTGGDSKEAAQPEELIGDVIPLREAAGESGVAMVRIISPGWGSSGYYSPEVLKRDGPGVFPAGTKMFWDHPTAAEESARPEGSLATLAGELTSPARWLDDHAAGAGLYAESKVFAQYRDAVKDLQEHIGLSIRAMGEARTGEAEGKRGRIIERLTDAESVDFVTQPGRGGKILQLFEAAGRRPVSIPEGEDMDEKELKVLREGLANLQTENGRLRDRLLLTEGRVLVDSRVRESTALPPAARQRVSTALSHPTVLLAAPYVKDGQFDLVEAQKAIDAAIDAEAGYLAALQPTGAQIRGLGTGASVRKTEVSIDELAAGFQSIGMSETAAKRAAVGRVS